MNAHAHVSLPSQNAAMAAARAVALLRDASVPKSTALELRPAGQPPKVTVEVPTEVAGVLLRVLSFMAEGHAVTILPVEAELTTQKAADLLGVSQVAFAAHLGVPVQRVNELVKGKCGVTPKTAWLLSQALHTTPQFWMNLQAAHDLARTRPNRVIQPLRGAA